MVELIKKILSVDIHKAEILYKNELEKIGFELYNKRANGCGNCLLEIYLLLNKNGIEMAEAKENNKRKSKLKDNVVLNVPVLGIVWTNQSNFTDAQVLGLLKKFPLLESRFDVLPDKKLAHKKEATKKVEPEKEA